MHPRWVEKAVREKPGMAGACGKLVGKSFARDKPAGAFVVSSKMLVGLVEYRESRRTQEWRTDGRSEGRTDGEDQQERNNQVTRFHPDLARGRDTGFRHSPPSSRLIGPSTELSLTHL